jgi:hypothetical protein
MCWVAEVAGVEKLESHDAVVLPRFHECDIRTISMMLR